MSANTRVRTSPRTTLNLETLEGRAMPSAVIPKHPQMADPALVHVTTPPGGVYVAGLSVARQLHNPAAMRVVSRIAVNGELVAKIVGKPHFAAIGPALSCDGTGNLVALGGTTVCMNGQHLGTFVDHPTITRERMIHINRHGVAARVLTYYVDGPLYFAPPDDADEPPAWAAPVGGEVRESMTSADQAG